MSRYFFRLVGTLVLFFVSQFSYSQSAGLTCTALADVLTSPTAEQTASSCKTALHSSYVLYRYRPGQAWSQCALVSSCKCSSGYDFTTNANVATCVPQSSSSSVSSECPQGQGKDESGQCVTCILGVDQYGKCRENPPPENCPAGSTKVEGAYINGYPVCKPNSPCPEGQGHAYIDGVLTCGGANDQCPEGQFWGTVGSETGCFGASDQECGDGKAWGSFNGVQGCYGQNDPKCDNGGTWGSVNGVWQCYGGSSAGSSQNNSSQQGSSTHSSSGGNSSANNSAGNGGGNGNGETGGGSGSSSGNNSGGGSGSSGSASSSGGTANSGDCSAMPNCEGDAIQCALLEQVWRGQCDGIEGKEPFDGDASYQEYQNEFNNFVDQSKNSEFVDGNGVLKVLTPEEVDVSRDDRFGMSQLDDLANSSSNGSCPPPRSIKLALGTFNISYEFFCNFATLMSPFVIFIFLFISSRIIYRALAGD